MRMDGDTFAALRALVVAIDTEHTRATYRDGQFPRAERVKDLDKRYRWDLYYAAKGWDLPGMDGLTDAHVDTALRVIVPPLGSDHA